MGKKVFVVSAVNFVEGGALKILKDCVHWLDVILDNDWEIYVIVNNLSLFESKRAKKIEYPEAKKSWIKRLYFEWFVSKKISEKLNPEVWLCLHDMSARVFAKKKYVYCHNPAPFYKISFKEAWLEPKFMLFNFFYGLLYGINIKSNNKVIVQQSWLKEEFIKRYGDISMVVSHPVVVDDLYESDSVDLYGGLFVFFYPAFPRVFKNFETILQAAIYIKSKGIKNFRIIVTLSGAENKYARHLKEKYGECENIIFSGLMNKKVLSDNYHRANGVLFPSKLETWGLPLSEAKLLNKKIICSDLPYAHETLGDYKAVKYVDPNDYERWGDAIIDVINDKFSPNYLNSCLNNDVVEGWGNLIKLMIK